ncbi:glycoside hydrolase family 3 N-terminal domain-containing protein [Marinilactibacillus sp. XAAS-LB27]|uniref:glycoside hydrolase family 3 N-terminal domain-containing protein n=1 Tax=Marinilactibacillus sp. XAAS-LB27 TaxID=3114538 RepID=UPI002E16C375|nr:glycoside hydrolase family 3 N-terminal domain-containing protein [Marinilactibacillus sp. XAAS-LB27]
MRPFENEELTIHERVVDLLSRLSTKEKVGQVNQHLYGWEVYRKTSTGDIELTEKFKEHVKWGGGIGALYGLFRADPWSNVTEENGIPLEDSRQVVSLVQRYIKEHTHLGIPALIVEECPHGHQALDSISYPTNIGRGAMFNPELIEKMSRKMSEELSAKGVHLALVSTLDLVRDPRWGRTEECFGEDPYLAAEYTRRVVRGFQGDLIKTGEDFTKKTTKQLEKSDSRIGVVLKHLIAQGDALGGHNSGDVSIGERELFDIYDPIMKSTVNAVGVMAAYNDIDGIPCHANADLLTKQLRDTLNFQGIVMADGGAIDRLQNAMQDKSLNAKQALEAGVNLSLWDHSYLAIEEGIENQSIEMETLDRSVYKVLSIKFLLGLFDKTKESIEIDWDVSKKDWQQTNLEAAKETLTLLKNDHNILPLQKPKTIAVIGPNANSLYNQLGDYTSPQAGEYATTIFEGIRNRFKSSKIVYTKGCAVRSSEIEIEQIRKACENSEVIILALGGSSARNFGTDFLANGAVNTPEENMDSGENIDVSDLSLGGNQLEILKIAHEYKKPIITIIIQGRPHSIERVVSLSDAVLIGWYPGQRGGEAIASLLAGDYSPSGKLNVSIPRSSGQLPVYYNQKRSGKKEDYFDMTGKPLYSFGEGLNYSKIKYSNLKVEKSRYSVQSLKAGEKIEMSLTISNHGEYDQKESVLCFIAKLNTPLLSRKKELKRIRKVTINKNQKITLEMELDYADLLQLDQHYKPKIFPCDIQIQIGSESSMIHLT